MNLADLGHLPGPSAAAGHRAQPKPDADQLALLDRRGSSSAAVAGGGGRHPLPPRESPSEGGWVQNLILGQ